MADEQADQSHTTLPRLVRLNVLRPHQRHTRGNRRAHTMTQPTKHATLQPEEPVAKRRAMRKGTRSCTECRKRKRRCVYPDGGPICLPCTLRGSVCLDQRQAFREADQAARAAPRKPPQRTSLICDSDTDSQLGRSGQTPIEQEGEDLEATQGVRPPLVPVLSNGQNYESGVSDMPLGASARTSRSANICKELRSSLPSYNEILEVLSRNGEWWESFRQKTRVISQAKPLEPLLTFANHAYTSESPVVLGTLTLAYGRSLGRESHLFALVDELVLADLALAATMYGMECLILLGKTYTDIGQPKKAWLTWRRGLAYAQLMGLHRLSPHNQDTGRRIWWVIYHGDRFTSLLLGLPHGFNDSHLDRTMLQAESEKGGWLQDLVHRSATVAGKVIDANVVSSERSLANAMLLDEEMDAAYNVAPAHWWEVPSELPWSMLERDHLVAQLLIQLFFFHIRMYIYLPFMAPSTPHSRHSSLGSGSKLACVEAGRQLLLRYLTLRTSIENGKTLFDCKTTDFVGFTAAVVVLMGPTRLDQVGVHNNSEEICLALKAKAVFDYLAGRTSCQVASQCGSALALLLNLPQSDSSVDATKIVIPYFGTFMRRHSGHNAAEASDVDLYNADAEVQARNHIRLRLDPSSSDFEMDELTWGNSIAPFNNLEGLVADDMGLSLDHDAFDFDLALDWTSLV